MIIIESKTKSIAKLVKKDFKNVHADVHFLAEIGLIDLKTTGKNRKLMPVAKFSEIELPLVA